MFKGLITACTGRFLGWARARSMKAICQSSQCCPMDELPCGVAIAEIPESADLMIVAGPVSRERALLIRETYDRMPMPRRVIALGACASAIGDVGPGSGTDQSGCTIPVDLYVPGCPPGEREIAGAIRKLREIVKMGEGERDDVQGSD